MATILSLFDESGIMCQPWRDAGHRCIQIDILNGVDVFSITPAWLKHVEPVYALFMFIPCTDFAVSGAAWFAEKDADGRTEASIKLAEHAIRIKNYLQPPVWFVENPISRIGKLVAGMAPKADWYFDPHEFAGWADDPDNEQYTKRTALWGEFNIPHKKNLPAIHGSKLHYLPPSPDRARLRSKTPQGFARAFYQANRPEVAQVRQMKMFEMAS